MLEEVALLCQIMVAVRYSFLISEEVPNLRQVLIVVAVPYSLLILEVVVVVLVPCSFQMR